MTSESAYFAFDGDRCIASGDLGDVVRSAKATLDRRKDAAILVFDGRSGPIDIDFRGSVDDVLARLPETPGASVTPQDAAAPAPAVPAVRSSAWSRARSRCCHGTGNGWRSNRAALRSHCAGWLTRQGAPTRTRTGSGTRRKRPIASSSAMAGEQAALRRSGARAVRRRCRAFRGMDGDLAGRRARSRPPARRGSVRTHGVGLIPRR